jgi:hypothetical protein
MPIGEEALGFGNRWYRAAFETAQERRISGETTLRLVRAPHFVATKLEAFKSRGRGSYVGSQDLEDIVAVIDGRAALEEEIQAAKRRHPGLSRRGDPAAACRAGVRRCSTRVLARRPCEPSEAAACA